MLKTQRRREYTCGMFRMRITSFQHNLSVSPNTMCKRAISGTLSTCSKQSVARSHFYLCNVTPMRSNVTIKITATSAKPARRRRREQHQPIIRPAFGIGLCGVFAPRCTDVFDKFDVKCAHARLCRGGREEMLNEETQ